VSHAEFPKFKNSFLNGTPCFRTVSFGYEAAEIAALCDIPPVKRGVKLGILDDSDVRRRIVGVSLGVPLSWAAMPHPSPSPETSLAGSLKRFATKPPRADPAIIDRLRTFVANWLKSNLRPLEAETDLSVDAWLRQTGYPEWRKQELSNLSDEIDLFGLPLGWGCVKSFVKD